MVGISPVTEMLLLVVIVLTVIILTIIPTNIVITFFEEDKIRSGSKVRIIKNSCSCNVKGDIGIVTEYITDDSFRVHVQGKEDCANWQGIKEVEILKY